LILFFDRFCFVRQNLLLNKVRLIWAVVFETNLRGFLFIGLQFSKSPNFGDYLKTNFREMFSISLNAFRPIKHVKLSSVTLTSDWFWMKYLFFSFWSKLFLTLRKLFKACPYFWFIWVYLTNNTFYFHIFKQWNLLKTTLFYNTFVILFWSHLSIYWVINTLR
jgi:hypothetical protein